MKTITAQKNVALQILLVIALAISFSINAFAGKQDRQVKNFSKIEISGAFNVTLTQGATEKLTIEASDEILSDIITEVKGGKLIIRLGNNTHLPSGSDMKAELTFINLDGIDLSGAVKVTGTNPMKFSRLEIDGSGATEISLDLSATELDCDFSGSSEIRLKGNAPEFEADLSGASNIDASGFLTRSCVIECSGASNASVNVTEFLKVEGSGASDISYTGNPAKVETDLSGASKLRKN